MSEEVGYLLDCECFYHSIGLLYSVYEICCEGMAERVQAFALYTRTFEESVISSSEHIGFGVVTVLITY